MAEVRALVNRERLLRTLLELLAIDSPSGEEAEVGRFVANRLRKLGLEPIVDPIGNVLARCDGDGDPLLLNAHLDNVPPCRGVRIILEDDVLRSDGTTVLGTDDKAGVASILEALTILYENGLHHRPLEIVFTVQEETGLKGAKALDFDWFRAREGIVVDGGRPITHIVTKAPSQDSLNVTIYGRTAHAGVQPEKGINAIRVAAEAIARMPLGRIDSETTANVGVIEGGRARNIVPDRCHFVGEARSHDRRKLEEQTGLMVAAIKQAVEAHRARVDLQVVRSYEAFSVDPDAPILRRILEAGRDLGLELETVASGGGSDANIFNHHGITCAIMGSGYEDPHTTSERILVSDFVKSAEILVRAICA